MIKYIKMQIKMQIQMKIQMQMQIQMQMKINKNISRSIRRSRSRSIGISRSISRSISINNWMFLVSISILEILFILFFILSVQFSGMLIIILGTFLKLLSNSIIELLIQDLNSCTRALIWIISICWATKNLKITNNCSCYSINTVEMRISWKTLSYS